MDNEEWLREIDAYFGFNQFKAKQGRPMKFINEDLLILYHKQGYSNRAISRELGFDRRTIDRRMVKLRSEGRIK